MVWKREAIRPEETGFRERALHPPPAPLIRTVRLEPRESPIAPPRLWILMMRSKAAVSHLPSSSLRVMSKRYSAKVVYAG